MTDQPASGSKRFWKLASMTAQVSGRFAQSKVKQWLQSEDAAQQSQNEMLVKNSQTIAKTLGELKGAVMKVGQMASITTDILPEPLAEALKALQKEAPPVGFEVIKTQVEKELEGSLEDLFSDFSQTSYAAASIGQVHRARLKDGREVIVKVQYPGVDKAMASDLKHLQLTFKASGVLKIDAKSIDALFMELKSRLEEELDYENEARNHRLFYDYYQDHAKVIVPELISDLSTKRILTLAYEPGESFAELWDEGYEQATINDIGHTLLTMLGEQIFDLGAIHADPNPANFACRDDGTMIIYDYGCVKKLRPETIETYRETICAALKGDYAKVDEGLILLGARNVKGPPVTDAYYQEWRDLLSEPYFHSGAYDFGRSDIHLRMTQKIPHFLTHHIESFKPPTETAFVDRAIGGHFGNLRRMKAACDVKKISDPFLFRDQTP